jgi:hypothetical protein
MDVSWPDILGEYLTVPERFETNGLQYGGYFEPEQIAAGGEVANFFIFLQNMLNSSLAVELQLEIPKGGGSLFGGGKPVLEVEEELLKVNLGPGEAGLLTVPLLTTKHTKEGQLTLIITPTVTPQEVGKRIRPPTSKSKLEKGPFDDLVGLNVVGSLGATYTEKSVKKASFALTITGVAEEPDSSPILKHNYQAMWKHDKFELFNRAIHELNLRQVKLESELTIEAIYTTLFAETTQRFNNAGLRLRIGEAIMMAKILTYTCQFFLSNPGRYNGLMVPIWERAFEEHADTTYALDAIRSIGYYHVLKLAVAMSFGLLAQIAKRQPWSLDERRGVAEYIADNVETEEAIELEFLYLPLLMAAAHISPQITLEGEDNRESLALLKSAYQARKGLFQDQDMAQAKKLYTQIMKNALKEE